MGKKEKRKRKRGGRRNAYFCIGLLQLWREKIHSLVLKLRKAHGLKWLQVRMAYHRFPNLGEILQGYMVGKLREGIGSKDFLNRECNCSSTKKVNGECAYESDYRACCVVYKVTCKPFLSLHVGNTQNNQKKEWNIISKMWRKKYSTK